MRPRTTLLASAACGLAAVALVAADLALNVEASLEAKDASGSWQTVSSTSGSGLRAKAYPAYGPRCGGPEFRLVVHNGLLWPASRDVEVFYSDANGTQHPVLRQTWSLRAGETRAYGFTVDVGRPPARPDGGKPAPASGSVTAIVGQEYLGGCAGDVPQPVAAP
jgi:hypothetical protein